jgi:GT2 family glycosyltransferase
LYLADAKFWIRGATYGTFRADARGEAYPPDSVLARDFGLMAASGLNAIRTYTVPPRRLLDTALAHGLRVLVGLPWEQHVAFLDDARRARSIEARVRAGVRACAGHPAVLAYAVGNEIPAPIVRWHGAPRIERFVTRLYETARDGDSEALVTYVNYPTTEYLELPFLDFVCFNVYLERPERYQAYLARLQNLAGDRPLVMAEIGLDSRRHGERVQARTLDWQLRRTFAAGCAGAFVFAWTDEWHRGGWDVEDWDFGLTDRSRRPKPALEAVRNALDEIPFPKTLAWPRVSVVVCTYNGSRTIAECLTGVLALDYPNFEVVVVNDGSTDATPSILADFGVRVISTPNRGLSSARNTGLAAATGDIVAYIDDDAYPDPQWLTYLAATLLRSSHVGAGGPNVPPPGDGPVAAAVASAPGGPMHVLVSDTAAEHVPGCNMAFWKRALEKVGGFDPQFRAAGDDVDICWRLQAAGGTLGFHPGAMVWHHRRNSVRAYWKQQAGYGRAEALLERKWPEKYNRAGHATWSGRLYGPAASALGWWRRRIYHGAWGAALFQSVYEPAPGWLSALATLPEWLLLVAALVAMSFLSVAWPRLAVALPLAMAAAALPLAHAAIAARRATRRPGLRGRARLEQWALTALLYLVQPLARLRGRLHGGLTPWRHRAGGGGTLPWPRTFTAWSERWDDPAARLVRIEERLRGAGVAVLRGGDWDRWDLEIVAGALGGARLRMVVEEHGQGRQLARFRIWPHCSRVAWAAAGILLALATGAALDGAWVATSLLGAAGALVTGRIVRACGSAVGAFVAGGAAATPRENTSRRSAAA